MIVLVDASVRIRFLSNRAPYAAELDHLLSRDGVSGHDFVYGGSSPPMGQTAKQIADGHRAELA